jgi:hypothetical protein
MTSDDLLHSLFFGIIIAMMSDNSPNEDITSLCSLCFASGPFTRLTGPLHITYQHCDRCQLIFMDRDYLPEPVIEEERYKTHQNGPQYPGYVDFLKQAIRPTLPCLI